MSDDDIKIPSPVTATERPVFAAHSESESFGLSATQRAIWFDQQLRPESIKSHITTAVRVDTDADPDVVRQAFADVVRDHESLRTTFHDHDGTPQQRVHDETLLDFRYVDAQEWSEATFTAELIEAHRHSFDLAAGPPVRFRMFRRGPTEHVAVIAIHHIVADMWSQALFGHAVATAFERATSQSDERSDDDATANRVGRGSAWTYRHFVEHEHAHIRSEKGSAATEFWRDLFESWSPQSVPADRPESSTSIGSGDAVSLPLDASLVERMQTFANDRGTSIRTLVLLAYQLALARTTDSTEVIVAETKATRNLRMAKVIGCCINQIPRRLRFDEATTSVQAVASIDEQCRASRPHESVPFEHLLHELRPGHGTEPFFHAAFAWQKTTRVVSDQLTSNLALGRKGSTVDLAGLQVAPMPMPTRSAPFPITLLGAAVGDDVHLTFEFQPDRFDRASIELLSRRIEAALCAVVEDPDSPVAAIDLSTVEERSRWQASWEAAHHPLDESVAVHHLIEQRAAATPSATAVRFADESLTYAELDQRADRLAARLTGSGVQIGDLVGICQDRSIDLLVSILATWKAGAGYVPMDPGFPVERLGVMLLDADVTRVVTRGPLWGGVCEAAQTTPAAPAFDGAIVIDLDATGSASTTSTSDVPVDGTAIAYVTFTSGSTGRPKGVVVEHRSVVNFAQAMARRPGIIANDTVLAATTLSFDISVLELIVPLVIGATVDLVDRETARDPLLLATALDRVTIAQGTPTMWKMLIDFGWRGNPNLTVLCGGEPLPLQLAQRLRTRCATLWNMYGPTETTVWSSVGRVDAPVEHISIGEPIDNTRLVVLDRHRRRCPDGVAGELWIGGAGVTRGYIGRPELTAERFVSNPLGEADGTLYRTGDLVRHTAEHGIEFLGRIDNQVKVRGHRVELGEIEAVIERNPSILQSVAAVREFGDGDQRIVAYYRIDPDSEERLDGDDEHGRRRVDLREHVRQNLPDYMVPAAFVRVDAFPRTPNDKIDRDRLPTPDTARRNTAPNAAQPSASSEHVAGVLGAYRTVFGDDQISELDDFFDLGGHSLLATRLVSRLRHRFGREIMLRSVFEHPTPIALASVIDSAPHARPNPNVESVQFVPALGSLRDGPDGHETDHGSLQSDHFPLSSSQERMWFLQQLNPDGVAYNLSGIVRIRGEFDIGLLQRAFDRVVERHTSLRSTFELRDGSPVVAVGDPFSVDIVVIDQRREGDRAANLVAAKAGIQRDAEVPFDLTKLPLFRVMAHRTADDELLIGLTFHHIIADQWAFGVLAHELSALIHSEQSGEPATLMPAPRAELYSQWQRAEMRPSVDEHLLRYWLAHLEGLQPLEIQPDHPRPMQMTGRGASITMKLPGHIVEAVRATARAQQASEFMVEFAAFQLHLHRETGASDIAVGVPIANRHWLESESLITTLVNTLVMRNDLSASANFTDLLARVRDTTLDAYAHQDLPFERLIESMAPPRDASRSPLFQIFFNSQNAPFEIPDVEGFDVDIIPPERRAAQFDLSVTIDSALTNTVTLEYATDLFDQPRMERFLHDYVQLLADVSGRDGGFIPVSSQQQHIGSNPQQPSAPTTQATGMEAPRPGLERRVAQLWERVLGESGISRHDDFFALGGHSILAVRIFAELAEVVDAVDDSPPLSLLFSAPTVASFAAALESGGWSTRWTSLVEVSSGDASLSRGGATPFFYVSPFLITALSFHELAQRIGGPRPFYAFQPQGLENDEPVHQLVEDMAEHYIAEMKTVQPAGPYLVGGHCAGGWVAFEMARQLEALGDVVHELVIVDVEPPGVAPPRVRWFSYVASRVVIYGSSHRLLHALRWRFSIWRSRNEARRAAASTRPNENLVREIHRQAHERYEGGTCRGDVTLIRSQEWSLLPDKRWHDNWRLLTSGRFRTETIPGAHARLLDGDGVRDLAAVLGKLLDRHA